MLCMSRIPRNANIGQKALYKIGESSLGREAANVSSDIEVRKHGWEKAKRVGIVALAAVAGVVGVKFIGDQVDRSPSVQKVKHEMETPATRPAIDLGKPVYTPEPGDHVLSNTPVQPAETPTQSPVQPKK